MRLLSALFLALAAAPAHAQDFSAGSEAAEWGLSGEEKARFAATVVDPLCLLGGDCPPECGAGLRPLALFRHADGRLVLPLKNAQPLFTGAAVDLARWCGQRIEVDGLLVGDPDQTPVRFFQVQLVRSEGAAEWVKADLFTVNWDARHPELATDREPWFRKDPRVLERLAAEGWFGLGPERDAEILREIFPP
jgi:hypothetical protein